MLKLLRNVFVALGIGVKKLLAVALFGNLSTDQGGTRGNLGRMTSDTDVSHPRAPLRALHDRLPQPCAHSRGISPQSEPS
jgi:hypothetical protein